MVYKICFYFLLFIVYSFLGWVMEVVGKLIEKHKFINRGFLVGPICPIYGCGCIIITLLLSKYSNNLFILFTSSIFICSILEYFTSYYMEKIFKTRWWDYTRRKFNLNGRICLETMIPFGILGCFVIRITNPIIYKFLNLFNDNVLIIISVIILLMFIVDFITSTCIIFNFRNTIKNIERDATEEITKKVKDVFMHKNYLSRRLIKAFPTMISKKDRLLAIKNRVESELKSIEAKSKDRIKEVKQVVSNKIKDGEDCEK